MATTPTPTDTPSAVLTAAELSDRLVPTTPLMSPDGTMALVQVAPVGRKGKHDRTSLWIACGDEPARQLTTGAANDTGAVWSPDSRKVAFLSDRRKRGTNRIYVLPVDGGEAMQLGKLKGELSGLRWSPDGSTLLVLREDPKSEAEKGREEKREDEIVAERDLKRTRLWVVDVESGKSRQLTFGGQHVREAAWSRDGQQIAVVTGPEPTVDTELEPHDISLVAKAGGLLRRIATWPMIVGELVFVEAPEGQAIAGRTNRLAPDPVDSIWLFPLAGGEPRELFTDDHAQVEWIGEIPGAPDKLAMRYTEGTHCGAYVVDVATAERTPVLPESHLGVGSVMSGPTFSANGERMAIVWSRGNVAPELLTGPAGGELAARTELGKAINEKLQPTEVVRWRSDEWEIQGILTYPAGYAEGTRYPLLILAHGGPTWQWDDHAFVDWHDWAQFFATRGYAVLAPNPRGSTGRGAAFQKALFGDVGGGEVRDLITGADAMVERGIADPEKLGIGGWSWGGYLTATTITRTTKFKAASMGAGLSNLISDHGTDDIPSANFLYYQSHPYGEYADAYWRSSALSHITACVTPTLILHGDADERVQASQGAEMWRALKTLGVPVEFVRYPREPHGIKERLHQIDILNRMEAWFDRWIVRGETPPARASAASER